MPVTIRQIQDEILDQSIKLPDILRKAKVLSYRLEVPEFKQWVNHELDGYAGNDIELPNYRNFAVTNYGNFLCADGTHIKNSPIPTYGLPELVQRHVDTVELRQGVAALEGLSYDEYHSLQLPWLPDLVAYVGSVGRIRPGCALQSAWQLLGKSQIDAILDTVRNRLLTYLLELEEEFPELAELGEAAEQEFKEQADAMFKDIVIQGGQNVIGVGSQVTQTIQPSIPTQDLVALLDYVRGIDFVTEEDVIELEQALEDEEPSEASGFGARVNAWLGKMTTKSVEGAAGGAAGQGVQLLVKAIGQYYGLPLS